MRVINVCNIHVCVCLLYDTPEHNEFTANNISIIMLLEFCRNCSFLWCFVFVSTFRGSINIYGRNVVLNYEKISKIGGGKAEKKQPHRLS